MAYATAINNSAAGVSQLIAQWIWRPNEAKRGYPTGNFICAACSFAVAVLAVCLRLWYAKMNRDGVLDAAGKRRKWAL